MNTWLPWVARFPRQRVLLIGDLVADHYIYGQTDRVSREAPVLIVRYESAEVKLGGAANVAANMRSLGGQVRAIGLLGQDEMGREIRLLCRKAGIQLAAVTSKSIQTETKTRILAGGMNTTRQQMIRLDRGRRGAPSARWDQALTKVAALHAARADAVVVSDYGAGSVGPRLRGLLTEVARSGTPVCVDSRYDLKLFKGMTICKPNEPELEALSGVRIESEANFLEAMRISKEMLGCNALLVTRGRNGMAICDQRNEVHQIPVHGSQEAVDVTGAGDTVLAALSLGLAAGCDVLAAAHLANAAGSVVVQKQGTATVSSEELVEALSQRSSRLCE